MEDLSDQVSGKFDIIAFEAINSHRKITRTETDGNLYENLRKNMLNLKVMIFLLSQINSARNEQHHTKISFESLSNHLVQHHRHLQEKVLSGKAVLNGHDLS